MSQPPLALSVPLSRFTPRVGGGSAFFVRHERFNTTDADSEAHIWRYVFSLPVFWSRFGCSSGSDISTLKRGVYDFRHFGLRGDVNCGAL